MEEKYRFNPKPEFEERMRKLLGDEEDYRAYSEIIRRPTENFIRCNTIKISPDELKKRLEKKWEIEQPFSSHKEIMLVKSQLLPGEIGKAEEHLLGYYYIQELSSMLSVLALNPRENEFVLDLCASPGSKTTQISACMKNKGIVIANDKDIGRIIILSSNLERCGCANVAITRMDGVNLCERLRKMGIKFDKILVDAPCSGEGTLRSSPKTFLMWSKTSVEKLSRVQKNLLASVVPILKEDGEIVYSTCTHAPEENEEVLAAVMNEFPELELDKISLPVKCRKGVGEWESKNYGDMERVCRVYPQDNNSEGFFVSKLRFKRK